MSLIHQRLYQTDKVTSVNIKEYIIDLAESLMSAYGFKPNKFDLNISVEKEELDVDLAIPLGLIINELLTNSFKYAYTNIEKPALNISLKGDKNLVLEIKDNGVGLDLNRWKNAKDSFGKKLIGGLVSQIGGKYTIENEGGTVFRMRIIKAA
jgi:two-component sensor histidine kinase